MDKISKTINLNDFGFDLIPRSKQADAKKEIGELVVNEILIYLQDGISPVQGYGKFQKLSDKYAKEMKGGNKTPNLELDGDMLDALTYESRRGAEIEVGIFKGKEVPKADGHNNFSGDSKLPLRRFIPEENENFKSDIEDKIKTIIGDYVDESSTENNAGLSSISNEFATSLGKKLATSSGAVKLSDVLGEDFLSEFLDGI